MSTPGNNIGVGSTELPSKSEDGKARELYTVNDEISIKRDIAVEILAIRLSMPRDKWA